MGEKEAKNRERERWAGGLKEAIGCELAPVLITELRAKHRLLKFRGVFGLE